MFLSSLFTRNTVSHVFSVRGSGVVLPFILVGPPSAHKCRRMGILKCSKRAEKDRNEPPRVVLHPGSVRNMAQAPRSSRRLLIFSRVPVAHAAPFSHLKNTRAACGQ